VSDGERNTAWDHGTRREFFEYYKRESESPRSVERFANMKARVYAVLDAESRPRSKLVVADIGCGPGTQSLMWARDGHRVLGLDVNEAFIDLARERSAESGLDLEWVVGSASELPWDDGSIDVCLAPELLEHVPDWETCVDELCRVLRPGGVLMITTTNKLCPVQQEFDLPLYSWYPARLKRRYERLAVTTRPELVGHATYPAVNAVNWFSYYGLRACLEQRGLRCMDRFDLAAVSGRGGTAARVAAVARRVPPLRFLLHVITPNTLVAGIRPVRTGA
jgi:2-polyprenyl-6-hydroxyphenyl methylase/3-demethylubiquinone-9 3-methyltransferase